jgi:hypothetical protein
MVARLEVFALARSNKAPGTVSAACVRHAVGKVGGGASGRT